MAMGYGIGKRGGGDSGPGQMEVARVKPMPIWSRQPPMHSATDSHPTGQRWSPITRGDSRSAFFPVDGVHQVRISQGVGVGSNLGEEEKMDRLNKSQPASQNLFQLTLNYFIVTFLVKKVFLGSYFSKPS